MTNRLGPDLRTGYWPGTEHLHDKHAPLRRLARIGHAEPFATLEERIDFWVSHGYQLEERSASRAELRSPTRVGCGLEAASCLAWFAFWPLLLLVLLGVVGQARERVVLEVTPEGVLESRSLAKFRSFR